MFFPKKWQNFMVRYLRGATARVARVAASEARPLLLLTRNEALEPIHKGLWGFARTVRLEELSVVIFFMWSTSNSGGVSFCRCESVNLFFEKYFGHPFFPSLFHLFCGSGRVSQCRVGFGEYCLCPDVLCAVAFKLKTGGIQCSNYVHRCGASWCRPCYWSWTGHVGRLRCTLDIDLHGSFEHMELRLASQSEEESEHQSDFYLDIFG